MDSDTIAVKAPSEVETSADSEAALRKCGEASEEPSLGEKGMAAEVLDSGRGEKTPAPSRRLRGRPTGITKNRPTTLRIEPPTGREDMATLISMINSLREIVIQQEETIKEMQEENRKEHQENKKEHQKNTAALKTELKSIKAIVQETTVRQPTYSEIAARGVQPTNGIVSPASKANNGRTSGSPTGGTPTNRVRDGRAVCINLAAAKADKTDYMATRANLQRGLDNHKVTEGLKVVMLRPGPADRLDVIFETADQADKARQHRNWATSSIPGSRIQPAEWGAIKLSGVPKSSVLREDGKTIIESFAEAFQKDNTTDGMDATVMQSRWLSRRDPVRKLGSLVIWLRNKGTAERLLEYGTAMLGAVRVFCSRYEARNQHMPCFNCGDYRHKQAACKSAKKCAICSEPHDWRACLNKDNPKCPQCSGAHRVFDDKCPRHPQHRSYLARQNANRAMPGKATSTAKAPEVEMTDATSNSLC